MGRPVELGFDECLERLRSQHRGRVAVSTPSGPHILPVPYGWVDDEVVVKTSTYSVLGTYGRGTTVAFEVSGGDVSAGNAWSVVARGRAEPVVGADSLERVASRWTAGPGWAGPESLFVRIRITELAGRLGSDEPTSP